MANATINYQVFATYTGNSKTYNILGVNTSQTLGAEYAAGVYLSTTGGGALPLGGVGTPKLLYIRNLDASNYVVVLDGVTEIARLPAGSISWIQLNLSGTLNVQANTANVLIDYTLFDAAA